MSNYEKYKDIFTQRRNSSNNGFEEFPIIVSPNSVLFVSSNGDLITLNTASLMQYASVGSASYALSASYASNNSNTASYALQSLSASYASNGATESASYATNALSASYASNGATETASYANTSSVTVFNGERSIKRTGYSGLNVGGTSVVDFLNNFFFPFVSATVSDTPVGTTLYQRGTSNTFTLTSTILANDEITFGSASVKRDGIEWSGSIIPPLSFAIPDIVTSNHSYQTFVQVDNNGNPTIISSNTSNVSFIYPYLWGMSTVAGLNGSSLYNAFTKQIVVSGDKTVSLIGNVTYIYFAYPSTYPALTSIIDPNGFEVIGNFEYSSSVSVSSNGLFSDWTTNYRVYRTKLVSDPNGNYQFNQ